jgi:hypothetical protein
MMKKKGTSDEYADLRLCQPKVVSFDVDDRFLMGFMGSSSEADNIVELGPIVSRNIDETIYTNF